jgi:hypothetical protein
MNSCVAPSTSRRYLSTLDEEIGRLVRHIPDLALSGAGVIPWSCPVPVFGDPAESVIATVGLNPSNREFVDENGQELDGPARRFHTLKSLHLRSWSQATHQHVEQISESCRSYFARNPYDLWFKVLDRVIQGTGASFYPSPKKACHLDLVPFATGDKWTSLSTSQRSTLLKTARLCLPNLLASSQIQLLVLNGAAVVREMQNAFQIRLSETRMVGWRLMRESADAVPGVAYFGTTSSLAGIDLRRQIAILGYNHNLQSSFGVTRRVRTEIARWIMAHAIDTCS